MATPTQIRSKRNKKWGFRSSAVAAAALVGVLFAIAGAAVADNLNNDAATTAGITVIDEGEETTITYQLVGNNSPSGDPNGCNASSTAAVTVTITKPGAVSGPSSLSLTGCGPANRQTATFSSNDAGSYNITHSISGGVSGSKFNNNADFTLTVNSVAPPNTAPSLTLPADITAEATSASGAAVSYSVSASDAEDDPDPAPFCSPASGSTFALGITEVNCSVTDSAGATTSGMFNVTVVDTTPPALSLPANITANATSAAGSAVSYSASANDLVDGAVSVNCSPESGSMFAIGQTTVNCSAQDAAGNNASGSFKVSVVYGVNAVRFLQPINWTAHSTSTNPDVSTFKAGSTVPVKVQVVLANGTILQPASALWVTPQKGVATAQPIDETIYADPAMSGSNYIWNATGQFHQYNWGSPKTGAGYYWLIGVKLDDGQMYRQYISLR